MNGPEVTAIRYATMESQRSRQFYRYAAYDEPDRPMSLDYYFWMVRDGSRVTLIDTGFSREGAARRPARQTLLTPVEALGALGIERSDVETIVVTHCHYDHIGNLDAFPDAKLVLQQRELDFWTGPHARKPAVSAAVEAREIAHLLAAVDAGRVELVHGAAQIAPGISVRLVGGHCPGQQIVTIRGDVPVVLCSDAVHFYEELQRSMPHHGVFELEAMYDTYDDLSQLANRGQVIVPGHEPAVMHRFPPVPDLEGVAVRIR